SNVYLVKGKKVIQCNIRDVTDRKHAEGALKESEERYRRLFEAAQDGVLLLNAETGAIVDANPFIVKMLGYSLDELIGKRLWEIRAFHDAAASRSRFKELQQEEYIRYEDLPLQTKDGQSRQVEFVSNVYLVKGKKVIQCNIRDITERKQLEVHLEASEERYHLLFENSIDAIFLTSPDGRISAVNPAACQMFGGTEEEIKRAGRNAIVDSSDPRLGLALEERARTGKFAGELTFLHRNGTRISGEVSTAQYNDKEGDVRSSMIIRDITERKRTENALRESDEKFHQLADNITDAFWIRSPDMSEVHYVSPAFERIWGRSVESLFANPQQWPEFILAEDRERVLGAFAGLTEVGSSLDIEYRIVRPAGEIRWVRVRGFQVRDAAHKLIRHIGIVTDITDRKQVEVHLQQSEERYRRLVEFSPSAIMVHSLGKFVYVNPAAIKLLGASDASELLGKSILDIAHPDYKELVRAGLATGINESMVLSSVEEKFIRLDQTVIDVEVGALPIEYDGMPAIQYVVRDITQQKRLQQQLVLSQKGESIGTLAGGIAHDFNNILGIILGYTFLIAKNKSDAPKLAENIAAINQTVQRGAALVRQILTFARKTDVTFEPISLTELAQELISMFQQTFPKIITFTTLFPKDLPFILADKTQIDQAILNLCVNARDAMPTGGSITIKAEEHTGERVKEQFPAADQDSYICLSVSDNGEGMNEEVRRRMFDPFFTTKPQGKGTGLGLSVVYGVVQSHRGFINVESEVGQGTTFRLYFPVPNASVTRADARPVKQFESGGTETILVVEDESLLLEMVRFLLESKGYKVLVAHDGAEAIEQYKNHRQEIALVLTDLGLPKMTGAEEFKRLKEIDPDVKVVFASGFIDPDVKSELQKGGADDFLQKPYMAGEILQVVRSALDKQRAEG
ncbi:MAG: PAS domain S-box protein, partial [Bacteroidota bacterium]